MRPRSTQRFDTIGAVWLSACLVAVLLPLSKTSSWGIVQPLPLALYTLGFAGFVGWYRFEQGLELPLVNVTLMRQRSMMLVNGAGLLLGFAMFSNMYASLALLQTPTSVAHGFGLSVVVAGLVMAPGAVAMMLTSPLSAWITDHHGARTSLWLGAAVIGFGYATRQMMLGSVAAIALSVVIVNARGRPGLRRDAVGDHVVRPRFRDGVGQCDRHPDPSDGCFDQRRHGRCRVDGDDHQRRRAPGPQPRRVPVAVRSLHGSGVRCGCARLPVTAHSAARACGGGDDRLSSERPTARYGANQLVSMRPST